MTYEWIVVAIVVALIGLIRRNNLNKQNKLFQCKTPEKLLELKSKSLYGGQEEAAFAIVDIAHIFAAYGMFEKAIEQINVIEWSSKPNRLKATEKWFQAILCYIHYRDFEQGLKFAKDALRLGKYLIGKKSFRVLIEVGIVLKGDHSQTRIDRLEYMFKRNKHVLMKLLIAWALANVYASHNENNKSNNYLKYCKETAPGCYPYHDIFVDHILV